MAKKYNKLWVFGDSHATPNVCVNTCDSFWALTAKFLNVSSVTNFSRPEMGFDSITHVLVCEQDRYDFVNDYFLIGLPPLERITIFDDYKDTELQIHTFDTDTWLYDVESAESHRGLINLQYAELDKMSITISDRAWTETQILRQIFLLTQWLDSNKANYRLINLSKNLDKQNHWGPSRIVLDYCLLHSKLDIFNNSLFDVNFEVNRPVDHASYGWFGHHGAAGNKLFFEKAIKGFLC